MISIGHELFRRGKRLSLAIRKGCLVYPILGLAVLGAAPGRARAELILNVSDEVVAPGESGYVDVYFNVTSGTPMLAFYMIELTLTDQQGQPPSGVRFVYDDAGKKEFGKASKPVFPDTKAVQTPARPGLPGSIAAAYDLLLSGENPIADGAGLLRIPFETDLGSQGIYPVIIETDELRTNFFDGLANPVTIDTFNHGSITVVVPEPGTLVMLLGGGLGLLGFARRRRRWSERLT